MSALQDSRDIEHSSDYARKSEAYDQTLRMTLAHSEAMRATGSKADQRDAAETVEYAQMIAAYYDKMRMALAHSEAMHATGSETDQRTAEETVGAIRGAYCREVMQRGLPNYKATIGPMRIDMSNHTATLRGARAPNPYVV